ncbi:hypothetical protein DYI42_12960 [Vannielia litorea]|nr:hypothetical protein [Vannielia litorea]
MGAPVFTEAELERAWRVAERVGAMVEVCPRKGTIRLLAKGDTAPVASPENGEDAWDAKFGGASD